MSDLVPNLAQLAEQINAEHQLALTSARTALGHARSAGSLLIQAKEQCGHGHWLPWLEANVKFSERTAQAYMRVAKRWQELEAKAQATADLTIEDGLKLLAKPAEEVDIDANLEEAVRLLGEAQAEFPREQPAWTLGELQEVVGLCEECIRHAHAVKIQAKTGLGVVLKLLEK
jgi:hypothetical protein